MNDAIGWIYANWRKHICVLFSKGTAVQNEVNKATDSMVRQPHGPRTYASPLLLARGAEHTANDAGVDRPIRLTARKNNEERTDLYIQDRLGYHLVQKPSAEVLEPKGPGRSALLRCEHSGHDE